jgi:hypothetical protein
MCKAWPSALAAAVLVVLGVPPAPAQQRGTTYTTDYDVSRIERWRSGGAEVNILRGTKQKEDSVNVVEPPPPAAKPEPQKMITNHRRRSYKTPAN